jgi:glycosyltransferase involved in cell wall biosynthesis
VTDPAAPPPRAVTEITEMGDLAAEAGLRRVNVLAWRDLDDPEAGGSELHAEHVARLWAEAGIDVTIRTSFAAGHPRTSWRNGHRVIRKGGRYLVFPRAAFSELMRWHGPRDGLVEIWNGMPFFSPLWATGPRVVFLHHHHAEMWDMTLPPRLARVGRLVESRLAPPLYRWSSIVTLSESSRRELVDEMHLPEKRISVVRPGIDPRFGPGGERSPTPLVVAVGRLVPVKRFDLLIEALADLRVRHPRLEAVVVGEGYKREELEALRSAMGADDWIHLPGRCSDEELIDLYRRAWVVTSVSAREGWGMSLTEAAACGTPTVATRISGHADAVVDGETGFLVEPGDLGALHDRLALLVSDRRLAARLGANARDLVVRRFTWKACAERCLAAYLTLG